MEPPTRPELQGTFGMVSSTHGSPPKCQDGSGAFGAVTVVLIGTSHAVPESLLILLSATLAFTMGGQAAGARHLKVVDVTTVVVTSTLTALAAESRLAGASGLSCATTLAVLVCGHRRMKSEQAAARGLAGNVWKE